MPLRSVITQSTSAQFQPLHIRACSSPRHIILLSVPNLSIPCAQSSFDLSFILYRRDFTHRTSPAQKSVIPKHAGQWIVCGSLHRTVSVWETLFQTILQPTMKAKFMHNLSLALFSHQNQTPVRRLKSLSTLCSSALCSPTCTTEDNVLHFLSLLSEYWDPRPSLFSAVWILYMFPRAGLLTPDCCLTQTSLCQTTLQLFE